MGLVVGLAKRSYEPKLKRASARRWEIKRFGNGKRYPLLNKLGNLAKGGASEIKIYGSLTEKFGKGYKSVSVARTKQIDIEYGKNLNAVSKGVWHKVFEAGYLNGSEVEVHYFYNSTTGQYANPFIKMGKWGSKVFKDLNK